MSQNQEIIESKLCAYIDGELDPEGRAEIEKHLEANPQHRRLLESLRATRDLIRWLPREPAPPEVAETLSGQLERSVLLNYEGDSLRVSPWPRILAAAAIVLLTAGLGVAVYYALPKSQKPAQLAMHSLGNDGNGGDIVPAPAASDARSELATSSEDTEKMRAATPEDLKKDRSATDSKLADESRANTTLASNTDNYRGLDELAQHVGQNPAAFLSEAANSNNGIAQKAAPSNAGAVVLLVRSNAPEQTEKQLTSYLNQQQIQWRQPAVTQQNDAGVQSQQQRGWDFPTDAAKKSEAEKVAVPGAASATPPAVATPSVPTTQLAQNDAIAERRNAGISQQVAVAPIPANSIPSSAVFVCQMSRRQAEQLSSSIGNDSLAGAQVQNVNGFVYNNSIDRNTIQNGSSVGSSEPTADQAPSRAAAVGGEQMERDRMSRSQTEPAPGIRESVEAKIESPAPTTQPAAASSFALNPQAPAAVAGRTALRVSPTTEPASVPNEPVQVAAGVNQQALGALAATTAPTTGPTDEPLNFVIMVQPNAAGAATTPIPSTQPAQESSPQNGQAVPGQQLPALK